MHNFQPDDDKSSMWRVMRYAIRHTEHDYIKFAINWFAHLSLYQFSTCILWQTTIFFKNKHTIQHSQPMDHGHIHTDHNLQSTKRSNYMDLQCTEMCIRCSVFGIRSRKRRISGNGTIQMFCWRFFSYWISNASANE